MTNGTKVENELDNAGKVVGLVSKVVDLAAESPELTEAGSTLAKSALTLSKAVNNCLLPIAAVNFAFDKGRQYFKTRFAKDIEEVTKDIPLKELTEPRASVAAPALRGLAFSYDEPNLKLMYLKLLSTAMDGRTTEKAHPAFAEIIHQLTSEEARLLNGVLNKKQGIPVVTLLPRGSLGYGESRDNVISCCSSKTGEQVSAPQLPSMIDNWIRLGLVSVTYDFLLSAKNAYEWVKSRPEYIELEKSATRGVKVKKGILKLTSFGRAFADAVATRS